MQGHIAGKQKSLCRAQNCLILICMLHSLYLCVSQSRAIPVTNIPQSSVVLHHDILILTHVTVQLKLVEKCLLYIFIRRPTLFLSSVLSFS